MENPDNTAGPDCPLTSCSASDEVRRMVFAFDDHGWQQEVRRIAARVKALEEALRGMRDHYRQWTIPGTLYNQVEAALGEPNDQGEARPPAKKSMNIPKDSTGGCCPPPSCSSWLPITDAPNSLAQIIVTDGSSAWVDQKLGVQGDETAGAYYFNGHEDWEDVTHWMPLPSLPNAQVELPPNGSINEP